MSRSVSSETLHGGQLGQRNTFDGLWTKMESVISRDRRHSHRIKYETIPISFLFKNSCLNVASAIMSVYLKSQRNKALSSTPHAALLRLDYG